MDEQTVTVNIPDVGPVDFPASWSDEQITAASRKLRLDTNNSKPISDRGMRGETGPEASMRAAGAVLPGIVSGITAPARAAYEVATSDKPAQTAAHMLGGDVSPIPGVGLAVNTAKGLYNTGKDILSGDPERGGNAAGELLGNALLLKTPAAFKGTANAAVRGGVGLQEIGAELPTSTPALTYSGSIVRSLFKPAVKGTGQAMEYIGRKAGGNLPFARRPLHEQMGQLPTEGQMPEGRLNSPLDNQETPFNQQSLFRQMGQLPDSGPLPEGRMPSPPNRPAGGDVRPDTPFHQQPLYQQMEGSNPEFQVAEHPRRMNSPKNDISGQDLTPELAEAHRLYDEMISKGFEPMVARRISGYSIGPAGNAAEQAFQRIRQNGGR